jgi:ribosomal protein L35
MPKLKTKKTLTKRVRVTKKGKIVKKKTRIGHLKRKWSTNRKFRKKQRDNQENTGHKKIIKKLLGKQGKGIK